MKIKVVTTRGQRASLVQFLVLRELIGKALSLALLGTGLLLCLFNRKKRTLHDYLAKTVVIKGEFIQK